MEALVSYLIGLANQNPHLASLFLLMGVAKAVFKPLMDLAHAYVQATASPDDDAKLAEVESSPAFKAFSYLLDYFAHIQLK